MAAIIGLVVGALIALLVRPSVPAEAGRYVAIAVVAAIDASFGGIRTYLERTFNDRIFVLAFVSNALLALGLVWIGGRVHYALSYYRDPEARGPGFIIGFASAAVLLVGALLGILADLL